MASAAVTSNAVILLLFIHYLLLLPLFVFIFVFGSCLCALSSVQPSCLEERAGRLTFLVFLVCNHPAGEEKSWSFDFSCLSSVQPSRWGREELVA